MAIVKPEKSLGNIVIVEKQEWFEANPCAEKERMIQSLGKPQLTYKQIHSWKHRDHLP